MGPVVERFLVVPDSWFVSREETFLKKFGAIDFLSEPFFRRDPCFLARNSLLCPFLETGKYWPFKRAIPDQCGCPSLSQDQGLFWAISQNLEVTFSTLKCKNLMPQLSIVP